MSQAIVVAQPRQQFPVFKTIKLGVLKTSKEYRKALLRRGRRFSDDTASFLDEVAYSQQEVEADVVVLSVRELGFKDFEDPYYKDVCLRAVEVGLHPCSLEVGPALRLVYGDQPLGKNIRIAVEATDTRGFNTFWLGRLEGEPRRLGYCTIGLASVHGPDRCMVYQRYAFIQPRK